MKRVQQRRPAKTEHREILPEALPPGKERIKCQAFIPDQPERDLLGIRDLLEEEKGGECLLVGQLRASWNSLLSWMREVQAWGQAGAVE